MGAQRLSASVLVDASNLRVGGGVQVAVSFLDELAALRKHEGVVRQFPWLTNLTIEASSVVARQVDAATTAQLPIRIVDRSWRCLLKREPTRREFDASFVVFGPEYALTRARSTVVGYADVTAVYRRPKGVPSPPPATRIKRLVRGFASRALTKRADLLITETHEFATQVRSRMKLSDSVTVRVVPNTVNGIFGHPERWLPAPTGLRLVQGEHLFLTVTRAYPHKNLPFLGLVMAELKARGWDAVGVTTLREDEWERLPAVARAGLRNVGEVELARLPNLYRACDAAVFPSLLEAFSAMPLEAMSCRRPLFAADRPFVRSVCGDAPLYFDPLDVHSAADVFEHALRNSRLMQESVERASEIVSESLGPQDRALAYLQAIDGVLSHGDSADAPATAG